MEMNSQRCLACGTTGAHPSFVVREMFFGSREEFVYFECMNCGSIQISIIPNDLARYYPPDYYSYSTEKKATLDFVVKLRGLRTDSWLAQKQTPLGNLLVRLTKRKPDYLEWFKQTGVNTHSRILDVGCGAGQLLLRMQRDGFVCLKGIDPFISAPIDHGGGLSIEDIPIEAERGTYDLIMFHHSFEHVVTTVATLRQARDRLAADGRILVRIPVAGGFAWRKYRQNWYSLDAPRHLFIPSVHGMNLLAKQVGLKVARVFFDSDTGQIVASERYARDIPLVEQGREQPIAVERQRALDKFVGMLNHIGDGDSAGFILGTA